MVKLEIKKVICITTKVVIQITQLMACCTINYTGN